MMHCTFDPFRARIAPTDTVAFEYSRRWLNGTVLRTNPRRALVQVGADQYQVPYNRLTPDPEIAEKREKRITFVLNAARILMERHGLGRWKFRFDHSTRRAGSCNYRDRSITLSFHLAHSGSEEAIRDTILHEIAHALVGKKHNHDAVWKAKAVEIGGSGERTHRLEFAPPRWRVHCVNHCWSHTAERRNPRLVCRKCGGRLVYSVYVQPMSRYPVSGVTELMSLP